MDVETLADSPKQLEDWLNSAVERDDLLAMDLLDSLKRYLCSRSSTSRMVVALLRTFALLISHPHMQAETETLVDEYDCPVRWIVKALQRQLCARPGTIHERDILLLAFEAIKIGRAHV